MTELEQRVKALEIGEKFEATKSEVQAVEQEFLTKLRDIKAALAFAETTGAASATVQKELARLQQENSALKASNDKLEYRVKHVVAEMERMYSAKQSAVVDDASSVGQSTLISI